MSNTALNLSQESQKKTSTEPHAIFRLNYQKWLICILTFGWCAFYLTALFSFSPKDPSLFSASAPELPVLNRSGKLGSYLASGMIYLLGYIAWFLPLPCLVSSWRFVTKEAKLVSIPTLLGICFCILSFSFYLGHGIPSLILDGFNLPPGGALGTKVTSAFSLLLGKTGSLIASLTLLNCGILLIFRIHFLKMTLSLFNFTNRKLRNLFKNIYRSKTDELNQEGTASKRIFENADPSLPKLEPTIDPNDQALSLNNEYSLEEIQNIALNHEIESNFKNTIQKNYTPPSLSIFKLSDPASSGAMTALELDQTAEILVKTFKDFSVSGSIVGYQPGPVVTVFEYQPDAGVKQAKILGLIDDLALALKVDSIFIHPVRGKRALGVQVPNPKRDPVYFGDIVKTPAFVDASSPLTFNMGKTIHGHPMCADLATMPHLLIAGATGSGKSVAINALLCSTIIKASPEEVRMILVDPKMLELSVYEGIPHLLMPVITEPKRASLALLWATQEMERRYRLMQHACVRHISGFNQFWDSAPESKKEEIKTLSQEQDIDRLPYILLVIDELADLMMTSPKDVECSIQRLAQKARASGIHMVLATQRPSVDIITGVIKANLPCRIAFQVVSKHDSRTILDLNGAEKLLGRGDMLFQRPGSGRLERLQGALITDEEVLGLVADIKSRTSPCYHETLMSWIEDEALRQEDGSEKNLDHHTSELDPKWDEALQIARSQGAISASFLQRQLKIGYNRAARIVEQMEKQHLVDKADGAKPRKWLGLS